MKEVWCRSALTSSKLPGIDYSLNPYIGCSHGCVYCYVPSMLRKSREEWMGKMAAKRNIPAVLRKELKSKRRGVVGISASTDAYQAAEKKYELTRKCLLLLLKHDWPIDILTKSPLVLRDISIIKKFSEAKVGFTITTLNEESRSLLEPYAPSIEERLNAMERVSSHGIFTYAFLGPLFPEVEEKDVRQWVEILANAGVNEVIIDNFHLRGNIWEEIAKVLPEEKKRLYSERIAGNYYEKIFLRFREGAKGKFTVLRAFM